MWGFVLSYDTGLKNIALIRKKCCKKFKLSRNDKVELTFSIQPESYTWLIIE
jgi:hypothetical protein